MVLKSRTALRGKHERSPLNDITEIRKQMIIDFIRKYHEEHKIAPTLREIAVAIGWKESSYGTVHPLVEQLITEGFLERATKGARTLMLVDPLPRPYYYRREDAIRALKVELKKT